MSITKNNDIYNWKSKLDGVSPDSLSTLGQENQAALNILSSRLGGVLNSIGNDKWDCNVRTAIQGYVDGAFKSSIDKAIKSSQFVSDGVGHVTNLVTACKEYVEMFDAYEIEKQKNVPQYEEIVDETTKETKKRETVAYIDWKSKIAAYEKTIPEIEQETLRVKDAVKSYFASVNFETNTQDGSIFTEGSTDMQFSFANYFDDKYKIIKEEYTTKREETVIDPNTGNVVTTTEYDVEREYVDGTTGTGSGTKVLSIDDKNGNKELDDNEDFNRKTNEKGQLKTVDGDEYDYEHNKEEDQDGLVHENIIVTESGTQQIVYEEQEDRTANYQDAFGIDTNENMKDEKTEETRTRSITRTYTAGENTNVDQLVFNENTNDSTCGMVMEESGEKYTYYRDASGVLHETYDNGNGYVSEDVVDEDSGSIYKFTVTDVSTGETSSYPINVYSRLDRAKMLYDMTSARRECGYNDESGASLTALEATREFEVEGPDGKKYLFKIEDV